MEYVSDIEYSEEEQAWVSPEITLQRNVYLMITLETRGKILIRQCSTSGKWVCVPIRRHKDTIDFSLRMKVCADDIKIKIFTSTKPKEIKYAYISTRH